MPIIVDSKNQQRNVPRTGVKQSQIKEVDDSVQYYATIAASSDSEVVVILGASDDRVVIDSYVQMVLESSGGEFIVEPLESGKGLLPCKQVTGGADAIQGSGDWQVYTKHAVRVGERFTFNSQSVTITNTNPARGGGDIPWVQGDVDRQRYYNATYELETRRLMASLIGRSVEMSGADFDAQVLGQTGLYLLGTLTGPHLGRLTHSALKIKCSTRVRVQGAKEGSAKQATFTSDVELGVCGDAAVVHLVDEGKKLLSTSDGVSQNTMDPSKRGGVMDSVLSWVSSDGAVSLVRSEITNIHKLVSREQNYTHLFLKMVLYCDQMSVLAMYADGRVEVSQPDVIVHSIARTDVNDIAGRSDCIVNMDIFSDEEKSLLGYCCGSFPFVKVHSAAHGEAYENAITVGRSDVALITFNSNHTEVARSFPIAPEAAWKTVCNIACKLGCLDDLVAARRAAFGWGQVGAWLKGIGLRRVAVPMKIRQPVGVTSVFGSGENYLHKSDVINQPTNLMVGTGCLVYSRIVGQEMCNTVSYLCEELGIGSDLPELASHDGVGAYGDYLLQECLSACAGDSMFAAAVEQRCGRNGVVHVGDFVEQVVDAVADRIRAGYSAQDGGVLSGLRSMSFSPLFGAFGKIGPAAFIGRELPFNLSHIVSAQRDGGAMANLAAWGDAHSLTLSRQWRTGIAVSARMGLPDLCTSFKDKVAHCAGTLEIGSVAYHIGNMTPRYGNETIGADTMLLVKTYLGSEGVTTNVGGDIVVKNVKIIDVHSVGNTPGNTTPITKQLMSFKDMLPGGVKAPQQIVRGDVVVSDSPVVTRVASGRKLDKGPTGVTAFSAKVCEGDHVLLEDVPGDGLCGWHAVMTQVPTLKTREGKDFRDVLEEVSGKRSWWTPDEIGHALHNCGHGLALMRDASGDLVLEGLGTAGLPTERVVGLYYDEGLLTKAGSRGHYMAIVGSDRVALGAVVRKRVDRHDSESSPTEFMAVRAINTGSRGPNGVEE